MKYAILALSAVLTACGSSGGSSASSSVAKAISGRAAKGAYLTQGSAVQVRTGSGSVLSTTVSDATGDFTFDVTGTNPPYLVRACDGDCTAGGTWYYSYTGSAPLQNTIGVLADVSGSLNNKYFLISAINSVTQTEDDFYVWENVAGSGADPAIAGKAGIEVDVALNVTQAGNATAIAAALSALTNDFATAYVGTNGNVVVLNNTAGAAPQAVDGNTGFTFKSEVSSIANVNPYTDMLLRGWYGQICVPGSAVGGFNIDDLFVSGVYPSGTHICANANVPGDPGFLEGDAGAILPDNTPIDLPNETTIQQVAMLMSNIVSNVYGINIENTLMTNWVQGEGFDALLDSVGQSQLQYYLITSGTMSSAWVNPSWMSNALAYDEVIVTQTSLGGVSGTSIDLHVDFWTSQSNMVVATATDGGSNVSIPVTQQPDSTATSFHYVGDATVSKLYTQAWMTANGDAYVSIQIPIANYGTGTPTTEAFSGYPNPLQIWTAPWTPGLGVTISTVIGNDVTFAISDMTPASATVTDSSGNVLGTETYNTVNPWSGTSGVITIPGLPSSFTLELIGTQGERTEVNYSN